MLQASQSALTAAAVLADVSSPESIATALSSSDWQAVQGRVNTLEEFLTLCEIDVSAVNARNSLVVVCVASSECLYVNAGELRKSQCGRVEAKGAVGRLRLYFCCTAASGLW